MVIILRTSVVIIIIGVRLHVVNLERGSLFWQASFLVSNKNNIIVYIANKHFVV